MKLVAISTGLCLLAGAPVAHAQDYERAQTRPWSVGDEREVGAGNYLKLVAEVSGWRIWKESYSSGWGCSALKPAEGVRQPHPFSSRAFYGSYPAVLITHEDSAMRPNEPFGRWQILSQWPNAGTQEVRVVGERFYAARPEHYQPPSAWGPFFALDGQKVEVHAVSHRFPAIREGRSEQTAVVDLTGLSLALAAVEECNAAA